MNAIERKIFFHINALKKSGAIGRLVISKFQTGEINSAIDLIQSRDSLLSIIFDLHRKIEDEIVTCGPHCSDDLELYKAWSRDVNQWANNQSVCNDAIEEFLLKEREATTKDIASIFDKKSRHQGYDLSSTK